MASTGAHSSRRMEMAICQEITFQMLGSQGFQMPASWHQDAKHLPQACSIMCKSCATRGVLKQQGRRVIFRVGSEA